MWRHVKITLADSFELMATEDDKPNHLNNSQTIITLADAARDGGEPQWLQVQLMARSLADALRSKGPAGSETNTNLLSSY